MVEQQNSKLFFLGIFPKCPYYTSIINIGFVIALITLGTVGLLFLNLWVAVGYVIFSTLFYFLLMPLWHCQYCYYKVKDTSTESTKENTVEKLMAKDKWVETCLQKHVECGKKWSFSFVIILLLPIIGIIISFFLNFSIFALLSLICFVVIIALMAVYLKQKLCPKCAIMEECHTSF